MCHDPGRAAPPPASRRGMPSLPPAGPRRPAAETARFIRGQCQAWTGMAGGLGCDLSEDHAPPPAGLTRHRDPATGLPWHKESSGALVLGPPPPADDRSPCPAGYIFMIAGRQVELGCDTHGAHSSHHDPGTGWSWRTTPDSLIVELRS